MNGSEENSVKRAMEILTLADVWELVPDGSSAPVRDGLICSPFRDERTPSFSISGGCCWWKDFGPGEKRQGIWNFVKQCRPEWDKYQVSRYLVEKAGLKWYEPGQGPVTEKPSANKIRQERAEASRAARDKYARDRRADLYVERGELLPEWSALVRGWFDSGDTAVYARMDALAQRRGWPVDWVDALHQMGVLRWPELPWKASRYAAFTVECPTAGGQARFSAGYHQRWFSQSAGKSWLFVPFVPGRAENDFCRALQAEASARGKGPDAHLVPPLPFVLGDPAEARIWIILEGQWDAITLWGALGGFEDVFDLPVTVFGLRGASAGPVTFLAYYGDLLRRRRGKVKLWLMPDNDGAAGKWDGKGVPRLPGRAREQFFTDRLSAVVGDDFAVPVSRVPKRFGKDFNDYWQRDKITRSQILKTMENLRLFDGI